jgi:hypothetical protein
MHHAEGTEETDPRGPCPLRYKDLVGFCHCVQSINHEEGDRETEAL